MGIAVKTAWQERVGSLKKNTYALYLASKDPRVSWLAKIIIALVIAYALSPIDLIPDFIPVIGYLDDVLLLPLGIWLAIRLIPETVWKDCQQSAQEAVVELPRNRRAGVVIIFIWLFTTGILLFFAWSVFCGRIAQNQ